MGYLVSSKGSRRFGNCNTKGKKGEKKVLEGGKVQDQPSLTHAPLPPPLLPPVDPEFSLSFLSSLFSSMAPMS